MKSLTSFIQVLLHECGSICSVNTARDLKTITSRVEHEGMSFLTISLSNFRSHFELSLGAGSWQTGLTGFNRSAGLPQFLGGFLLQVFDAGGTILDDPSVVAIQAIRQLTGFANKVLLPTTEARNRIALTKFVECETSLAEWEDTILPSLDLSDFDSVVSALYGDMFTRLDLIAYSREFVPKHGPGATADKLKGNQKYKSETWYQKLEEYFPAGEFLFPNFGWYHELQNVKVVELGAELPVKITLVPKTLKTPRIIAIEPTAFQYCQQGVLEAIEREIEQCGYLRKMLSWSSQIPNQKMAKLGSITGELATLDLSEASDRVSNALVKRMLRNHPHLLRAVQACRSDRAVLPGISGTMPLRKFASMGSALCFPFESMLFLALTMLGTMRANGVSSPRTAIKRFEDVVRTYGDDIICPTESATSVIDVLEGFALKVNHTKSFWTGKFRESCGKEYFSGHDVGYVKLRRMFPDNRQNVEEIASLVSMRNLLFIRGYVETCDWLDRRIRKYIPFPANGANSGGLTALSYSHIECEKFDTDVQAPMIKAATLKETIPANQVDGHGALMKFFLKRSEDPFEDVDHLLRSGRPVSLQLKTRWIAVDKTAIADIQTAVRKLSLTR